jgi:oligosaccharide repeat unit polymerase
MNVRIYGKSKKLNSMTLKKGVIVVLLTSVVFWLLIFVTRSSEQRKYGLNILGYIASYAGGSISSLDVFLKNGSSAPKWFGEETFVALNNNLASLFGLNISSARFLEFGKGNGFSVVNIYGAFRRFYHDFGYAGVGVLSFIQGLISSRVYKGVRTNMKFKRSIDFGIIFYCYFFYTIIYTAIDELFYSSNISISGLVKVIILWISYILFFYKSRQEICYETEST